MIYDRYYPLNFPKNQSVFLLGPRKTGKTTFLKKRFPNSLYIDLLQSDVARKYSFHPERLRQELQLLPVAQKKEPIIIDEVQLIPSLFNEIHWLIENADLYFILCGSSVRKLKSSNVNMLGGRAWTYYFFPFVFPEIQDTFHDVFRLMKTGTIPSHCTSKDFQKHLDAYVQDYLTLEIKNEGHVRNLPSFQQFLEVAAFSCGEMLNMANISREAGVSEKTIKAYFDILEDSLIGKRLLPFSTKPKRNLIFKTPKFYYFDVGLTNNLKSYLSKDPSQESLGHAFESYIFQELYAYSHLQEKPLSLHYWRTTTGKEVDFILNNDIAIEVKLTQKVHTKDTRGLISFAEHHPYKHLILVCNEPTSRLETVRGHNIKVFNVKDFLSRLWQNEFIVG